MEKLSVVIITLNEAEYIQRCLDSVQQVADEILVLDSYSTDQTREICLAAGADFKQHPFDGYIAQKNRALSMARHSLVLSLDGDEALDDEAIEDIKSIKKKRKADGYVFKRKNNYCGKWMRFTSMYPDRKLRLVNKNKAQWGGYNPHDKLVLEPGSTVERLHSSILHWVYRDQKEHQQKLRHFAQLVGKSYYEEGRQASRLSALSHTVWRYMDELIIKGGIFSGSLGWQFAHLSAKYTFLKYKELRKLNATRN